MSVLIVMPAGAGPEKVAAEIARHDPAIKIRIWPDVGDPIDVRFALAWRAPAGIFRTLPKLEAIFSYGAGVDHLLSDPQLPAGIPIVRFVDPDLTQRMVEYVVLHTLFHHRRMTDYLASQQKAVWREFTEPPARSVRVGIMGFGVLGEAVGRALTALGYHVAGWSRGAKTNPPIACFFGLDQIGAFLNRTDILVVLLPLTAETRGIINSELLGQLATDGMLPGPVLINAGRGGLQREADILAQLNAGALYAASLDVFEQEPLPKSNPLWSHPRVIVTPHNAAVSSNDAVARYVLHQMNRHEQGLLFENVVDVTRGY